MQCKSLWIKASANCINVNVCLPGFNRLCRMHSMHTIYCINGKLSMLACYSIQCKNGIACVQEKRSKLVAYMCERLETQSNIQP